MWSRVQCFRELCGLGGHAVEKAWTAPRGDHALIPRVVQGVRALWLMVFWASMGSGTGVYNSWVRVQGLIVHRVMVAGFHCLWVST